jgi:hypothetical protein
MDMAQQRPRVSEVFTRPRRAGSRKIEQHGFVVSFLPQQYFSPSIYLYKALPSTPRRYCKTRNCMSGNDAVRVMLPSSRSLTCT